MPASTNPSNMFKDYWFIWIALATVLGYYSYKKLGWAHMRKGFAVRLTVGLVLFGAVLFFWFFVYQSDDSSSDLRR